MVLLEKRRFKEKQIQSQPEGMGHAAAGRPKAAEPNSQESIRENATQANRGSSTSLSGNLQKWQFQRNPPASCNFWREIQ